jgi:hypothetical protein
MSPPVIDAQVRHEIESLVYEHAWLLDNHESERIADLYLEDGRLYGIGPERRGAAALTDYGEQRAALTGRVARHVCTNLRLAPLDDGRIKGHLMITLYRHDGEHPGPAEPCALADAHDIYGRDSDGRWKLAERRLELIFESESHKKK